MCVLSVVYPVFTAKPKCLVNVSFVFDSVLSMVQSQSYCFFKRNANIFKRWKHLSNSDTIKGRVMVSYLCLCF